MFRQKPGTPISAHSQVWCSLGQQRGWEAVPGWRRAAQAAPRAGGGSAKAPHRAGVGGLAAATSIPHGKGELSIVWEWVTVPIFGFPEM